MKRCIALGLVILMALLNLSVAFAETVDQISASVDTDLVLLSAPTKILYAKDEQLDLTGLRVQYKGTDVSGRVVASGFDSSNTGEQHVTLSYNGQSVTVKMYVFGFTSASLTLEGKINLNFYGDFPGAEVKYTPGVLFYTQQPTRAQIEADCAAGKVQNGQKSGQNWRFVYDQIAAKEMNDQIWAVPVARVKGGGCVIGKAAAMSAAEYVSLAFDTYEDQALRVMLVDMLNYGAAAQEYFSYRTNALANAALTAEQRALASQNQLTVENDAAIYEDSLSGNALTITGASLTLENQSTINLYAVHNGSAPKDTKLLLFDEYVHGKVYDETTAIETLRLEKSGERYIGCIANIPAKHVRKEYYARMMTTYDNGAKAYSDIVCYSEEAYVATILSGDYGEPLAKLAACLLRYGDSAAEYFGNAQEGETGKIIVEDFEIEILDDGACRISKYIGTNSTVVIPSRLNDYAVVEIGKNSFMDNQLLQSVTVSDTVIKIGESAFEGCTNLEEAYLSDNVEVIGRAAFKNCKNLSKMN